MRMTYLICINKICTHQNFFCSIRICEPCVTIKIFGHQFWPWFSITGYKIKTQVQPISGKKRGDQTSFLTYIGPHKCLTPSLDLPLLHLHGWVIFFMESNLCQNKILQMLWTVIPSLLNHTQFSSLHEYTQIRDEIGFREVLGGHQPLLDSYLICLTSTSFNSRFF